MIASQYTKLSLMKIFGECTCEDGLLKRTLGVSEQTSDLSSQIKAEGWGPRVWSLIETRLVPWKIALEL